eukprot:833736-Pelagomonas_calceolata.AAC.3
MHCKKNWEQAACTKNGQQASVIVAVYCAQATMGTLAPEATPSSEENSVAELQQQQEQQIHQEQEQQLLLLQQQQQQQEQSQQLLPSAFGRHMLNPKRMSTGAFKKSLD